MAGKLAVFSIALGTGLKQFGQRMRPKQIPAKQAPLSGSYREVDAMGLFWSMELDEGAESPHDNHIKLTAGQDEHLQAEATIERLFFAPGVTKRVVCEQGLSGTLFTDRAMLPIAQLTNHRDDIQAKLAMRQRPGPFLLNSNLCWR